MSFTEQASKILAQTQSAGVEQTINLIHMAEQLIGALCANPWTSERDREQLHQARAALDTAWHLLEKVGP